MKKIPRFVAPLTFREALAGLVAPEKPSGDMDRFASRFAELIDVPHAVVAPSARIALSALLSAFDFPKGGEVILPALTFHSIPQVFQDFGLKPVFVDIRPDTYCIDPDKIEEKVNDATVAIVPTHLYGRACDMDAIGKIAKKYNLTVIEDCAQSAGGFFNGKRLGSFGDASFFSFGPTKNLSALWAGMAVAKSEQIAKKASLYMGGLTPIPKGALARRLMMAMSMRAVTNRTFWTIFMAPALRVFSMIGLDPIEKLTSESPEKREAGDQKARLMPRNLQGRYALSQLDKLDVSNQLRIRNGEHLQKRLQDIPGLLIPSEAKNGENIFMSFPVQVNDREAFRKRLLSMGVDTATGYMSVGPDLPGFETDEDVPASREAVKKMVHLPVYPEMELAGINRIADVVVRALVE